MNLRTAVLVVFALCITFGLLDGYFLMRNLATPRAFDFLFAIVVMIAAYLWYRRDSMARSYSGSTLLAGAIILISPLAIPFYLAKSREKGKKTKSILLFIGFIISAMLVGGGTIVLFGVASGA